ncbi:CAP domain-containing protein [Schlegelella sp. S2-27]|uniref:CAP domain-containing protein n=1 Tax=Caldimonas mangrovi TaxID=2944811 RepID=A0ABT0YK21_9BURK|nr:CAP domain-containing protein [Caldimonas mangrovi]MCM5679050.1 CAP domain-containing protein [Caldimonas mangrovi]
MKPDTARRWVTAMALTAAMAACGGGSGNDETSDDTASPNDDGSPSAGADIACGLPDFQAEALRLINQRRAAGASCGTRGSFAPTTALTWDPKLAQAAYGHALDMANHDYFSHTGRNGSTLGQRVSAAGYTWSAVAENIAAGTRSVSATVDGWMGSDGHCANLMSPGYRHAGLACALNTGSTYGRYWVLNLAAPR